MRAAEEKFGVHGKDGRSDERFVRKGQVGSWRSEMSARSDRDPGRKYGDVMRLPGYPHRCPEIERDSAGIDAESNDPKFEFINYYGNTSLFALDVLCKHGLLAEMKLLSVACLMPHLADYLAIFQHRPSQHDGRNALPAAAGAVPGEAVAACSRTCSSCPA